MIEVEHVTKTFNVPIKGQKGIKKWIFRRNEKIDVLTDLSFSIKEGEFVGYLGPNGAGKSTTIKLLTGILHPTQGSVKVLGFNPHKQRHEYAYNMGVVFGQRSLLEYDIPVIDSFLLYKAVYNLDERSFKRRLEQFTRILHLDELLHVPVRKLSLGQRMRCEIAASLLHKPKIIFLDEPTIGLDAVAKQEIRAFLKEINKKEKVTIILTTHDMDDIEMLCDRVIFINKGKIIFDGEVEELKKKYVTHKEISVTFKEPVSLPAFKVKEKKASFLLKVEKDKVSDAIEKLFKTGKVVDVSIKEPRLEEIVRVIYREEDEK